MSKTREELIDRALKNLGALPAGHVASAEDAENIDALIDPLVESLNAREIVYIADANQIPDEYFLPLAECLAGVASPEYGSDDGEFRQQKGEEQLRDMLRRQEFLRGFATQRARTDYPMRRCV